MPKQYFNTITSPHAEVGLFEADNKTQTDKIYELFRKLNRPLTPVDVQAYLPNMLLTSIRWSISVLTAQGKLIKGELVDGKYDKPNHQWRLNT